MKKITLLFTALITAALAITGCLKDTKFNNNEYGIKDPASSTDGVGFTLGSNTGIQARGLFVTATTQNITDLLIINVFAENPPSSDVAVTVTPDTSNLPTTNAAGTALTKLPTSSYNTAAIQTTIKAGQRLDSISVPILTTIALDPNKLYVIAYKITAANGYTIASNFQRVVVQISIKNRYDGHYRLKTQFYHPSYPYTFLQTDQVNLETSGPNSVKIRSLIPGISGYFHPWATATGGSVTAFGSQEPEYTVGTTAISTGVYPVTVQNSFNGAVTFYTMGKNFNNAGFVSRWDSASKTVYANFGYNLSSGNFVVGTSRMWVDTLIYLGPR